MRATVEPIANDLAKVFGNEAVLYDKYHEAEFARGDLASYLPRLYREQCDLVVAVFDDSYKDRDWTGLEWNAIHARHKSREYQSVMLLSVNHERPDELFGLDGVADITDRTPGEVAVLILERLAINEGLSRDHYLSSLPAHGTPITAQLSDSLRDELYLVRRDRNGKTRRKALLAFIDRLEKEKQPTSAQAECRINVWKQLVLEARFYEEYSKAAVGLRRACDDAFNMLLAPGDKWLITRTITEAFVDLSQKAPGAIETNNLVALLNVANKKIGTLVGLSPESIHPPHHLSEMLATRAKCRRALATLINRRMQTSKDITAKIKTLRQDALADATKATEAQKNEFALMEQALSLFANASSPTSENALAGLDILEWLVRNPNNVLASYEFVRQMKLRHRYSDAIRSFYPLYEAEQDRRRFNANLTLFATSIIGLHYSGTEPSLVSSASIDAINWLQDAISTEHHRARDIVDYCYLLAISGKPIEKFMSPLLEINNGGTIDWNVLGQRANHVTAGSETLGEALLMGLEDANIWNRIGTLYLDFANDSSQAIVLYDQAIHFDPRSPMYHYNKARALTYGKHDYVSAKHCLTQSRRLAKNMWGWFKVNEDMFIGLERFITENIATSSPPNET